MFNFDEARYLRIQSGAIAQAAKLDAVISDWLAAGANNVFFLGTGGAAILMQPAVQLLQRRSHFQTFGEMSAELVQAGSVNLGKDSIVIIPSLSGTTKESIAALDYCQAQGAKVLSLVGHDGSPLAVKADATCINFAADDTSCESFYLQSLLIAHAILKHRGEVGAQLGLVAELQLLPPLLLKMKRSQESRAIEIANVISRDAYHIITGAGNTWPEAFYYSMCILEEMQWIRTRPVHASDFFHGTLELIEKDVSLIVFKGEDAGSTLAERVIAFAPAYTDKLTIIDTTDFTLPGISPATRALLSPVLLAAFLERVNAHLEAKRNHPLTTRRYYKRVAY